MSAERVISFIENLTHSEGPAGGTPFVLRDWQLQIVRDIYAPVNDDGYRTVRTCLLTMPRKNGKTQLCAALVLYHLLGDGENGAQVYSAAADRNQAALIFNAAAAMVRNDPELMTFVNIIESQKRIVHHESGSFYQALSSESRSKHGFSASTIIYDELAQAPNRELWDVLTTSTGARAQPLTIAISTLSPKRESIMYEQYDYGCRVRDGVIEDPTFLPIIYQAPDDADIYDEAVWFECNPALGDFRSLDEMRMMADRAKVMPAAEASFRNLYLNQLVDGQSHFINRIDWMAGKSDIDLEALRGRKCWGGLDLASTTDLTALTLVFPDGDDYTIACWFWVPKDRLAEREHSDRVPYPQWARDGHLETPEGRAIDKSAIIYKLAELSGMFEIEGVAYDRWRLEDLDKLLVDEGINLNVVGWGQGYKDMGPAVDALETAILHNRLSHNSPVLDWCAANAVVTTDPAGARKIDKSKATERVDGIVALSMAIGLHQREPEKQPSVYQSRGIVNY